MAKKSKVKEDVLEVREVEESEGPSKYEIEGWANDVVRAQEILNDSEKMKLVSPIIEAKKRALEGLPVKSMQELKERKKLVDEADEE